SSHAAGRGPREWYGSSQRADLSGHDRAGTAFCHFAAPPHIAGRTLALDCPRRRGGVAELANVPERGSRTDRRGASLAVLLHLRPGPGRAADSAARAALGDCQPLLVV